MSSVIERTDEAAATGARRSQSPNTNRSDNTGSQPWSGSLDPEAQTAESYWRKTWLGFGATTSARAIVGRPPPGRREGYWMGSGVCCVSWGLAFVCLLGGGEERRGSKTGGGILSRWRLQPGASPRGGGGGHDPRTFENRGGRPPQKFGNFSNCFLEMFIFSIFQHFQNKVAEIRGETKFWQ